MTEGQTRYQTLMENQRHNLELERQGEITAQASQSQAASAAKRADTEQYKAEQQAKRWKTQNSVENTKVYNDQLSNILGLFQGAYDRVMNLFGGGIAKAIGSLFA